MYCVFHDGLYYSILNSKQSSSPYNRATPPTFWPTTLIERDTQGWDTLTRTGFCVCAQRLGN